MVWNSWNRNGRTTFFLLSFGGGAEIGHWEFIMVAVLSSVALRWKDQKMVALVLDLYCPEWVKHKNHTARELGVLTEEF
jgi:hypothetical protein